jgi:hypothetical protein
MLILSLYIKNCSLGLFNYIIFQSSSDICLISLTLEGKFSVIHHFRMALSLTPNYLAIWVKGIVRIRVFNSSRVGLSTILAALLEQDTHKPL